MTAAPDDSMEVLERVLERHPERKDSTIILHHKVIFNPYITPYGKKVFVLRMLKIRPLYMKVNRAVRKLLHLRMI